MVDYKVTIDIDDILGTAMLGVRRAAVFMGLGVNAASDPNFKNYALSDFASIQIVPPNLNDEKIDGFKRNFKTWVVGCGLRELIESFNVFLDQIHLASVNVAVIKCGLDGKKAEEDHRKFEFNLGLKDKLRKLREDFEIEAGFSECLISISDARNCLAHRRGLVGKADLNEDSSLAIKYRGLDIVMGDDNRLSLGEPFPGPIILEKDTPVGAQVVDRILKFELGKLVDIPPGALAEICWFFYEEAKFIIGSFRKSLEKRGVPFVDKEKKEER